MRYVYFCRNCKKTFSDVENNKYHNCPECSADMVATNISLEEWESKSEEEKIYLRKTFENIVESPRSYATSQSSYTSSEKNNTVGTILSCVGWGFIIVSILCGILLITEDVLVGFTVGLVGCFGGLLLIGFSEIINLLQDIKNK